MAKLTLNSISSDVFRTPMINGDSRITREQIVGAGRLLAYEHSRKGVDAINKALHTMANTNEKGLNAMQYRQLNEKFRAESMLYAARKACDYSGETAPESFDELKRNGMRFAKNAQFFKVLAGIYQEIITPILPAVYGEAVQIFADTVDVGFGETYSIVIDSNDIPVFQDTAWGAQRSVPRNRLYAREYTLNPIPRTAQMTAKWVQLVSNGWDFGRFFANLTAGLYAKTMGLWNQAMTAAVADTSLVPTNLKVTFSSQNWVALANKLAAVNNTSISNMLAYGSAVALSKVLPTAVTGSTNVTMDAAIATLLGAEWARAGYLGEYMSVRLLPLTDVIIPGTQNTTVDTMLAADKIWMVASNGRKPMTIAYNPEGGITFEMDPLETGDFEIGINMTFCIDSVATFASKMGVVTIQ